MFIENCEEKNYRDLDAFNFSMVSSFEKLDIIDFHKKWILKEKEDSFESYFMFGDAVDTLLTDYDNFWNKFELLDKTPTDKLLEIAEYIIDKTKLMLVYDKDALWLEARNACEYYMNYKPDTILKKLKEDVVLTNYIERKLNSNKKFISTDMYNRAVEKSNALKNHTKFAKYFKKTDDCKIFYQPVIVFEHPILKAKFKCKLDILFIDFKNKKIEIIDLKTTSKPVFDFKNSIKKYRYDFQATLYTDAVKSKLSSMVEDFENFDISFSFLVINSLEYYPRPVRFFIDNHLLNVSNKYNNIKSIEEIIDDILWHKGTEQWLYKRGFEENEVVISNIFDDVQ